MKKIITILISCSLALAANVIAQQDQEQQNPKKEKGQTEKSHPANEAKPASKPQSVPREHAQTRAPGQKKGALKTESAEMTPKPQVETKVHGKEPGSANAGKGQVEQPKKERSARHEPATANTPPASATAETSGQNRVGSAPQANKPNAQAKKPDPQTIQKIKTEHANFRAQPRPDKVPAVTFNQSYRISGSEQWQGPQYEVFRSYHPERHEQGWYRSHFTRIELIGGGYYYWNSGYWYPAWGYDPSAEYYAYDAPIYVGSHAEPPDRVIADVQAALQEMGYYQGEVDGLLGPLTRQALTAYQADHGLYTTEVIDEPTLQSLGMG
jgi:hypothetical protein